MRGSHLAVSAALGALAVGGLAACGGGDQQDAGEPSGTFTVAVAAAFPKRQEYATRERMAISVVNRSDKDIPNVTATVDGFYNRSTQPQESDPLQPVWIVNRGPVNGYTALTNTWALGPLPAGKAKTFTWQVTPMQSGSHLVHYRVNASLYGTSKAVLASGAPPEDTMRIRVDGRASTTEVDGKTGAVVVTGSVPDS